MLLRLSVIILALGAPFLAYWLRSMTASRPGAMREGQGAGRHWPILHLFVIGTMLCGVSLVVLAMDNRGKAGQVFVPAHLENGALKPGHFERSSR